MSSSTAFYIAAALTVLGILAIVLYRTKKLPEHFLHHMKWYSLAYVYTWSVIFDLFVYWGFFRLHSIYPDVLIYEWISNIFENLQSEDYQFGKTIILLAYAFYAGSSESRESSDRIEAKLDILAEYEVAKDTRAEYLIGAFRDLDRRYNRK